jgi:sulfite exporter TauE/SafE
MPCGASYAIWLFSAAAGSAIKGALTMFVWEVGTVPLMFIFGMIGTVILQKYSKWMIMANVTQLLE